MEKGYTIPIVDISNETERQFLVDREDGLYLGHPTTVLMDDNKTVFCVYPKCHGGGQIAMKKSTDGGKTWGERLPVPDSWSTSLEVPTIFKTYDKAGTCHLLMFSGFYPLRMAHSEDGGETWSELEPIGDYGGIVGVGDIICTGPGEYMAFFHDEGNFFKGGCDQKIEVYRTGEGNDVRTRLMYRDSFDGGKTWSEQRHHWIVTLERPGDVWEKIYESHSTRVTSPVYTIYAIKSVDGGLTWGEPKVIAASDELGYCEPAAVRSPDGKQIAVLLRENRRKRNAFVIFSNDNGETWTEPQELPAALTGDRHCIRYTHDGRLFITFRDMAHISPTRGSWVGWVGTYDDIVNSAEGQYRIFIMKNYPTHDCMHDCGYPGVVVLPDDTIAATTYGHWTNGDLPYVMTVRFKLSELDAKLKQ